MNNVTRSNEPHTRLGYISAEMTKVLDSPENEDIRAIVFLNDDEMGGIQIHGYGEDGDIEAMADIFIHLKKMFQAIGKDLDIIGIPDSPEGL